MIVFNVTRTNPDPIFSFSPEELVEIQGSRVQLCDPRMSFMTWNTATGMGICDIAILQFLAINNVHKLYLRAV